MKPRFACLLLAAAGVDSAQSAQTTLSAPTLRMGLWQTEITVEISGLPGSTGAPGTVAKRYCMKAESWKQAMQQMQTQDPSAGCTTSNLRRVTIIWLSTRDARPRMAARPRCTWTCSSRAKRRCTAVYR